MDSEKQIEVLARLRALKLNLPDSSSVEEQYVQEFHTLLELLSEMSGRDLTGFRVPDSKLLRIMYDDPENGDFDGNEDEDAPLFSDVRYCARNFLVMQIDGVLIFFGREPPPKAKQPIGFGRK